MMLMCDNVQDNITTNITSVNNTNEIESIHYSFLGGKNICLLDFSK